MTLSSAFSLARSTMLLQHVSPMPPKLYALHISTVGAPDGTPNGDGALPRTYIKATVSKLCDKIVAHVSSWNYEGKRTG